MKVTKSILREMIEAEINLLNEAEGDVERTGFLGWRNSRKTLNALLKWLDKDDRLGDISANSSESDRNKKRKYKRKFEMIWSQIDGAIIQSDIEENETLSDILVRGIEKDWIDDDARTQMSAGQTASGIAAPIAEIEVEIPEEDDDDLGDDDDNSEGENTTADTEETLTQTGVDSAALATLESKLSYLKVGTSLLTHGMYNNDKVTALQQLIVLRLAAKPNIPELQTAYDNMKDSPASTFAENGAAAVGIDGDFGPKTRDAVKALQKHYGINEDGKVGRQTITAFLSDGADSARPSQVRRQAQPETPAQDSDGRAWIETIYTFPVGETLRSNDLPTDFTTNFSYQPRPPFNDKWNVVVDPSFYLVEVDEDPAGFTDDEVNQIKDAIERGLDDIDLYETNAAASYFNRFTKFLNELTITLVRQLDDGNTGSNDDGEATSTRNLEEIEALIGVTTLDSWTEEEFVRGFEDWIVNGFGGNDFGKEITYMNRKFEEKLDALLGTDFSGAFGGNLSPYEKNNFKEKTGSTSLYVLEPGKLTADALKQELRNSDTAYNNETVDDAFIRYLGGPRNCGTDGCRHNLKTGITIRKSAEDGTGTRFGYTGHEEFIILLAAMKKLRRMKDELSGFLDETEAEAQTESLSYDRFKKLAGILG